LQYKAVNVAHFKAIDKSEENSKKNADLIIVILHPWASAAEGQGEP